MANEFDKILRDNFREPKQNLLRQLVPVSIISIRPLVPKLQQTILERETDTIAEVQTETGSKFIVHLEWQSSNDPQMAGRMAMYDLMLAQTYQLDVMGIVIYVGNDKLRMTGNYGFFGFNYSCPVIDARQLASETFLASDDLGEVIFAVLTGEGDKVQKEVTIRRIFTKLQQLFQGDSIALKIKIKQLELLSLLRGEDIQQIIIKEEQKMPVTIDITKDQRHKQGLGEGIDIGAERTMTDTAKRMFENGFDISTVQKITGLEISKLEEVARKAAESRS